MKFVQICLDSYGYVISTFSKKSSVLCVAERREVTDG